MLIHGLHGKSGGYQNAIGRAIGRAKNKKLLKLCSKVWKLPNKVLTLHSLLRQRDVAQSGLEYSSGGRVVASSNLVIPTERKGFDN